MLLTLTVVVNYYKIRDYELYVVPLIAVGVAVLPICNLVAVATILVGVGNHSSTRGVWQI